MHGWAPVPCRYRVLDDSSPQEGTMTSSTQVEVFADVLCPFTHVGLRRLVERRESLGRTDVGLWVRSWPLEVVNGHPLDAAFVAEEVLEIREQVAPDLFAGFDPEAWPATAIPALALAVAAYRVSPITGEAVSLELRHRLFERGEDISDADVLAEVSGAYGVETSDDDVIGVHREHAEGVERKVTGSPHFFTAHQSFFCPVLKVGRDEDGALRVRPDHEGFDQFMEACFGI